MDLPRGRDEELGTPQDGVQAPREDSMLSTHKLPWAALTGGGGGRVICQRANGRASRSFYETDPHRQKAPSQDSLPNLVLLKRALKIENCTKAGPSSLSS